MTDRDPYGRRSGRIPDDRDYPSTSWDEEGLVGDPYDYQAPRDPRRPIDQPPRQPVPPDDPYGAADPYPPGGYRQPAPYRQPDEGEWDDQAVWPDRPYAPAPRRQPPRERDPYGGQAPRERDPYAGQAPRRPYDYEDQDVHDDVASWEERRRGARRPPRASRQEFEGESSPRPGLTLPSGLTAAISGQDSRLLLIILGSAVSIIAMAAVVALRVDSLDGWFPLQINAAGETTKWGSESALWRLPFSLAMLTVMNLFAGFVLGLRDRKITWLLIGGLPLIHVLAWIALILIAW